MSVKYIGHGQLESAPQASSILHVISHELGHVAEFRNEAIRDSAEIRSLDVSIEYEMRDGKLVAVAGETRATTVKKTDDQKHAFPESLEKTDNGQIGNNEKNRASKTGNERSSLISDKEWEILSQLHEIELELDGIDKNVTVADDAQNSKEDEARRHMELVEKKRKLEMALSQEKLKALLKETLDTIQELNEKQIQFAGKVYGAGGLEFSGNFIEGHA
ncbi:hypothetical protein LEP1GSC050_3448 [Leptospira broomii serovar Hurstbridge str. 5399]|uniref:Uncharacterized protein n=2 Tax=Leptospira broomii TaxID=301541 RepID=T0FDY0_9LEPT|nr:hypothetical protein LEP1GSC050_3448 [Leptospira broomii serovar Hurstbridge str. 5399]